MRVAVVVPFRGGCPHREASWMWVQQRYAESHPDWQLVEAPGSGGEWCKAAAVGPAVASCDAEIIVQADADVWTDGLPAAVDAVAAGAPWSIPHLNVHRLSEGSTAAVLAGEDWQGQPLTQRPYRGVAGGGIVVASRTVLEAVPLDARFRSWGQEDESHAIALNTLVGPPWRGEDDLVHLFHPPQERMTRRRGSRESWELRKRYFRARDDPAAMAQLIEESRDASPTSQHALRSDPALGVTPDGSRRSQMEPFQQQREDSEPTFEATPAAAERAHELGINPEDVTGTGSNGRVTRDDVEAHAEKLRDGGDAQGDDSDHTGEPHDDQSAEPEAVPETENPVTERAPAPVQPKNGDDCVRFRCPTNPNFNLQSHKLGRPIRFTEGCYETGDPAEIAALRACQFVEEVSE